MSKQWLSVPQYAKRVGKTRQYIAKLVRTGKITKKSLKPDSSKTLINPVLADADLEENISYVNKKTTVEQSAIKSSVGNKTEPVVSETEDYDELSWKATEMEEAGLKLVSLAKAQEIRANYDAFIRKLEYEEKSGKLINVSEVEKDVFNMARRVRDALLNIPDRISAELASMTDTHIINDKLATEISQALEELSS